MPTAPKTPAAGYDTHKEKAAARSRAKSKAGREIGPLPPVADPVRKDAARRSFRVFCETYLCGWFTLAWSADHLTAIEKLERAVMVGGQFAFAMARGSGKSSLCEAAVLWAGLNGLRVFIVLIGATEEAAVESLATLKTEIESNDLLAADYPEVVFPVRAMEGIGNRAGGQTLGGVRTRIAWSDKRANLPTVAGSPASGTVIRVAGLTGRLRGMKATTADGRSIRPDLAIADDPQTDESAVSPAQNAKRERLLNGAVLGLAGPKRKIACFVPLTCIAPGDLADRVLDRDRHPVWQGQRSRMVLSWPTDQAKWDTYADLRKNSQRAGGDGREANEFYLANRAAMDAGGAVGWPARFNDDEAGPIQHAWNLRIDRGERAFQAEFQNDPLADLAAGQMEDLDADAIAKKVNRLSRFTVPTDATTLTAFADVQQGVLFYCVTAWSPGFGGAVVDYGTYPPQNRAYFSAADARPSLADQFPGRDETARIFAGVKALVGQVVGRSYPRDGGGEMRVGLMAIDSGKWTDTIHEAVRQSPYAALLVPSKGYGLGAKASPMSEWTVKPGERVGTGWRIRPVTGGGRGRLLSCDVNFWKSFLAQRLLTPAGGLGCLQLFGDRAADHQLFGDHLASEYRVETEGRGRRLEEWSLRAGAENHWWDTLVGCAITASVMGVTWSAAVAVGESPVARPARKTFKLSERAREKAGNRPQWMRER